MTFEEPSPSAQAEGQVERFVEAAVAPLVKNIELQHAAKNVMRSMVLDAGALADATRRMESRSFKWKRWLLPMIGLSAVLALAAPSFWLTAKYIHLQEAQYDQLTGIHRKSSIPLIKPDVWNASRLSRDEKMILIGDDDATTEEGRLKAIVDRFPDRPDFYAEYAEHCVWTNKKLPNDFDTTVARIDPENGYFSCLKALEIGHESVELNILGSHISFNIRDSSRLHEANQWIHRAANAREYRSYKNELREQRSRLLPPREDLLAASLFGMSSTSAYWRYSEDIETYRLYPIAEIQSLGTAGQEARFRSLLDDYQKIQRRLVRENPLPPNRGIHAAPKVRGAIHLASLVANRLNIEPEHSQLNELDEWMKANSSIYFTRTTAPSSPSGERMMERASSLHRGAAYFSNLIPEDRFPPDEALTPGRLAEHAQWCRDASLLMVALLAVLAWLLLLYRFRHGRLPRLVTHSLKRTLRPVDYLWILLLGIGLPLLWHQAVRQSPWGGLDFNLQHGIEKLIAPQWGLLAFMVLMATTIAARWRVKRRIRGIDLGIGRSVFTWICLILTAATMPLMQYWVENPSSPDESILVAAAVPSLWFVVSLTRGLFIPVKSIFGQLLVSRVTATSWLLACVVFAACAPIYYQVERHWVARDTLLQSPDFPNALEKQVVTEMNREDLELLDRMKVGR